MLGESTVDVVELLALVMLKHFDFTLRPPLLVLPAMEDVESLGVGVGMLLLLLRMPSQYIYF